MDCTIRVAKTKALISFAGYREANMRLCFRICKSRFSHNEAHIVKLVFTWVNIFLFLFLFKTEIVGTR